MPSPYYRPSGRVPFTAYPIALAISIGLVPFAWLYAWLTIHAPLVFNLFIAFGFSFAIGWVTKQVAACGKVRDLAWIGRAGMVFGVAGWYLQWSAWAALTICAIGRQADDGALIASFVIFVTQPWLLIQFAISVLETGTATLFGWTLKGAWLAGVWLVELWMLLMVAPLSGRMRVEEPFCEATNQWAEKIVVPRAFLLVDGVHARPCLEQDPHAIRTMLTPAAAGTSESHAEVVLYRTGGPDAWLSLTNILITVLKNGSTESKRDPVIEYLRLPDTQIDELVGHLTEYEPAAESAVAPALAVALEYLQAERYTEALGAAGAYASGESSLRPDATRICALAACGLNRWEEAAAHFVALFEVEPTAHNALQIATSSVMAGALPVGLEWIERAKTMNAVSHEVQPMTLLTSFVTALRQARQEGAAMPFVAEIRQAYTDLGCTDPTFLYLRSMPFFDAFLSNSLHFVRVSLAPEDGRRWYNEMLPSLDPEGRATLGEWIEAEFGPSTSRA